MIAWRGMRVCFVLLVALAQTHADDAALRALIARADVRYQAPAERSEEGLPIGNGRMGSLVWTTPTSVRLQINRVDVQAISGSTASFPERHSDYVGGCAFVDIELGGAGVDVFAAKDCPQRLSLFDGQLTLTGRDVTVRAVAVPDRDIFAIEIDDRRPAPQPISVHLRMLRYSAQYVPDLERMIASRAVTVRTREHTATSQLHVRDQRIMLTQVFREGAHHAQSAVVAGIMGRDSMPRISNESTVSLASAAGRGRLLVLIASDASLGPTDQPGATARRALEDARNETFASLAAETAAWWRAFWQRGSLALNSADGVADYVAANYHYFLYLMATTSRGKYPPKFNGMLWNTAGDLRTWGAQHWFANLSCYYEALFASNRLELLEPMFALYFGMRENSTIAARQQWDSAGIFIPETVWFDGLAPLPEEIAAEMRDLYLLRKPWAQRSARFLEFASSRHPHSSRWNWWGGGSFKEGRWSPTERGHGPFGPVTHILGTTAKVAYLFWRRYEYTLDEEWLRDRAYPMLRDAAEFYRNFPNLRADGRGVVHLHHTNSNESVLGARDSDEDLSALRGLLPAAIRASKLLGIDESRREQWAELLATLAPLPTTLDPDALNPGDYDGPAVFVRGRTPVVNGRGFTPDGNSLPQWFFDLCNGDPAADETAAVANATFDRAMRSPLGPASRVGVLSKWAIAGTTLGRVDATRFLVPNQMRSLAAEREGAYLGGRPLANRLSLREGHQALDAQRLGRAAEALQIALLNSTPGKPSEEPVIRLFSAWPADWDARFTLRARGGFVVQSEYKDGRITFVDILSESGADLRLRNPWGVKSVLMEENENSRELSGSVLVVPTTRGRRIRFTPIGSR